MDTLPRCEAHQASFVLVDRIEVRGESLKLTVSPEELLHWCALAASFDGRFHQALLQRLAAIQPPQPKG